MHVSIRDDTLTASGFDNIAEGLRFYGLPGVELWVERTNDVRALTPTAAQPRLTLDKGGVAALGEQAARNDIRISAFCLGTNFNAPNIADEISWIVGVVKSAARLGVPVVRIDAIMQGDRDLPQAQREEIFARGVRDVLVNTKGLPVDLGIENHGFRGNDPGFLDATIAQVGSPRLGLTMDTGNFYWAGYPLKKVYAILEHFAPLARHTHVKNIHYPEALRETQRELGYEYGRYVSPITEGDIDHARVVRSLKAAGYDRDLCIEDESLGKYDEAQRRVNIKAAADYLQSLV